MVEYREGNIVRIHLKDFLTYDDVEFYPKPYLNVIIGPNGTGKSSILCAICIGLGGKPEVTGRGKNLHEYIKHDKETATIEIELKHKQKNVIVKREFDRSNRCQWNIQGAISSQKDVEALVKSMNIQIDNLCQFLPQDRVTEFAKLNKIQLLHNTETAVGEEELSSQHKKLCEGGRNVKDMEIRLEDLCKRIETEQSQNDQLKDQVETVKMRKTLGSEIKTLQDKILYSKYNESRLKYLSKKSDLKRLKKDIVSREQNIEPLKHQAMSWTNKIEKENKKLKSYITIIDEQKAIIANCRRKIDDCKENVDTATNEFNTYEEYCQRRSKEIDDLKKLIESSIGHMRNLPQVNEDEIKTQCQEITNKMVSLSKQCNDLQQEMRENGMMMGTEKVSRQQKLKFINSFSDVWKKKLNVLLQTDNYHERNVNKQIYEAALWVHQNKEQFRSPIHGPMFSVINVSNPLHAQYVENAIPRKDLVAFVCEDKEDMNEFKRIANRRQWTVNILHSGNISSSHHPNIPIQKLQAAGFEMYVKDAIETVPAVLSYLCRTANIHNTPFGSNVNTQYIPDTIRTYFKGIDVHRRMKSRYDNEVIESVYPIRPISLLKITADTKELKDARLKVQEMDRRISDLEKRDAELKSQLSDKQNISETLRNQRQELQNSTQQVKSLQMKISQLEEKLKRRESDTIDVDAARSKMELKIQECMKTTTLSILEHLEAAMLIGEHHRKSAFQAVCIELAQKKRRFTQDKLSKVINNLKEQKSQFENFEKEVEEDKAYTVDLIQQLVKSLNMKNVQQLNEEVLSERIRKEMGLPAVIANEEALLEELQEQLADREAHLQCIIAPDEDILHKYEERQDLIERLQSDVEKQQESISKHSSMMDDIKNKWLPHIEELTDKISSHFSSFMSKIGCAGEVSLDKGTNENDFTQYGLSIRVKFRDTEKLKDLTAHQQSGGERSVSTALYLMALQTLTAVPFRCVDEINQGMDAQNERRMFTMLVDSTTTSNASQYFLITPKVICILGDLIQYVDYYWQAM